jgi:hypothetical protein
VPYMAQQPHSRRRSRSRAIGDARHDALEALDAVSIVIDAELPTLGPFADTPWIRNAAPKPEYL